MQDFRYALRTLRRQPVFTLVAVLTLTLGIGANTAIFSLLYQALLRPLPYADADRLVFIWNSWKDGSRTSVSIPDYLDRRRQAPAIEDATLFTASQCDAERGRHAGAGQGARGYRRHSFRRSARSPRLGAAFTERGAVPGADRIVILTDATWRARFGADAVGRRPRTCRIDGQHYEIVGVLPADFELPARNVALLVPFAFTPAQMSDAERGNEFSEMIARLAPGATVEQLDAQMQAIVTRLIDRLPARAAYMRNCGVRRRRGPDARSARRRRARAAAPAAGRRAARAAHRLRQRRQPAADARDRPRTRAGDPVDARRGALANRAADARPKGSCCRCSAPPAASRSAAFGVRCLVAMIARSLPAASQASLDPVVLALHRARRVADGARLRSRAGVSISRGETPRSLKEDGTRSSASRRTARPRDRRWWSREVALAVMLLIGAGLLHQELRAAAGRRSRFLDRPRPLRRR